MNRLYTVSQAMAVAGLSAVSIYTTAIGIAFLTPVPAAWIAACAIQVVLVGAAAQIRASLQMSTSRVIVHSAVYLLAVLFSVSGSFVTYDRVFSSSRRNAENESRLRSDTTEFVRAVQNQATRLAASVERQAERLNKKLEYEKDQGVLSGAGPGFGPHSVAISTLLQETLSVQREVIGAEQDLNAALRALRELPSGSGLGAYQAGVSRAQEVQGRLAAYGTVQSELLAREAHLGRLSGDFDSGLKLEWPASPTFKGIDESQSSMVVVRAYHDLYEAVPATVISMIAAILTDVLLLMVVFVGGDATSKRGETPVPITRDWRDSIRRYASFVSKHNLTREMELWSDFAGKFMWGIEPVRVLQATMTRNELGLLDWLLRAGLIQRGRTGTFVTEGHGDELNAFFSEQSRRLISATRVKQSRRAK